MLHIKINSNIAYDYLNINTKITYLSVMSKNIIFGQEIVRVSK